MEITPDKRAEKSFNNGKIKCRESTKCISKSIQKKAHSLYFWGADSEGCNRLTRRCQYDRYLCQSPTWKMQCQWGVGEVGATLNSDQGPNHWKTPTWLQCRLPGQHEQGLPTVAAKLQTPSRIAGKPGGAGNFAHSNLTRRAKTKRHAGYILARTKAGASLCDTACQGVVLALANQYPPAPSLRHTHIHTHVQTGVTTHKCFWEISPSRGSTLPSERTRNKSEKKEGIGLAMDHTCTPSPYHCRNKQTMISRPRCQQPRNNLWDKPILSFLVVCRAAPPS